jgi:RNA polymerase sigma factor (sigma-70 family)
MAKGTAEVVRRHIHKLVGRHNDSQATDRELLQRFTAQQDDAAFEALFRRHGAMVLAAGRRILGNGHDAEDVCQAVFLLLAKKASSQRWQASVANWLYTTTHLLALKARTAAIRRARREGGAARRSPANPLAEITGQELLAVLDEELLTLPEPLRAPLVLCYLQGATRDEAAHRLGCPLATLKHRLERGRAQLHTALVRRGLGLSAVLLGTLSIRQTTNAAATLVLARKTAQAALALAAGKSVDGVVSSQVSRLVKGGVPIMHWNWFKAAVALVLVGGLLSSAGALALNVRDEKQARTPRKEASALQAKNAERLAATPTPAQGATLRYQFKEGDKFSYVVEMKTESRSTAPGFERVVSESRTYDVTWRVTNVDSDGNARMTLTVDRLRHLGDSGFPGSELEFDSKKHKNPVGVPALARVLSTVLKAQVGAEFTCTMSPQGEVSDFKVPKQLADAVKNTQGMTALYNAESFKQLLASQGSVVLPKNPVYKGAGWSEKTAVTVAGGHAKMTVDTKTTYQGEADRGGKKLQEIALKPMATTVEGAPTSGIGPFTLKNHEGKGNMLFDNDKGRLVESEVSQTLEMESGAPGQTVVWKVRLSFSTKLVPPK